MVSLLPWPWLAKRILDHALVSALLHFFKKMAARVFDSLTGKLLGTLISFDVVRAAKRILVVSCVICAIGVIGLTAYGLKKSLSA